MDLRVLRFGVLILLSLLGRTLSTGEQEDPSCAPEQDPACAPEQDRDGDDDDDLPEYLIVGGGGSGIQTALFLQKYNHSFALLEKERVAGSFWTKFPVFEELISVNKWVRNETQKYRFDWHSMLEAPLDMLDVSLDYFPKGKEWQTYMERVVEMAEIPIEYGVEVKSLSNDRPCVLLVDGTERCARRRVFVATGLREKEEPLLRAMGGIPYSKMTKERAFRKTVCIFGNGNAGFEVAQNTFGVAQAVFLMGKRAPRLSAVTRYTGDVRTKFLQVLENFYGKLLDSVLYLIRDHKIEKDPKLNELYNARYTAKMIGRHKCEVVVIATGFDSFVPGMKFDTKFPSTNDWYTADFNPNIHYVGWLMHERDFRKGAGGFLSGYRYLIRNLINHVRELDHGVPFPTQLLTKDQVIEKVHERVQTADDLVILQDGVILRDAYVPLENGLYQFYQGVTFGFHEEVKLPREDVIYFYFSWGKSRSTMHVFDNVYSYDDTLKLINSFLHPVFEVNGLQRHIVEDLYMVWLEKALVSAVDEVIRSALDGDLSSFAPPQKLEYQWPVFNSSKDDIKFVTKKMQPPKPVPLQWAHENAIKEAFETHSEGSLETLRVLTKNRFPHLIPFEDDISVASG